jgi:S-formylglutathione hydrolase
MIKTNKLLLPILALLLLIGATSVYSQAPKGKLVPIQIDARSLKDNFLGDPSLQDVDVYLPAGYDANKDTRYPVVYLLHGYTGTKEGWTKNFYQGMSLAESMDELISAGKSKPMIVVAPNAKNAFGGSFYMDSSVTGLWATYISKELVEKVDHDFRTIQDASGRGIAGHSMGGYGALMLGMMNPKVYSAIYALSPCCMGFESDLGIGSPGWQATIAVTDLEAIRKPPFTNFFAIANTAMAAALSPNMDNRDFYVNYPFKMEGGNMVPNEPTYSLWKSKMPIYVVDEYKESLHGMRGIAFDVGENEEFRHIIVGTGILSRELAAARIPHTYTVYAGADHVNKIRERFEQFVIPFFSRTLADAR